MTAATKKAPLEPLSGATLVVAALALGLASFMAVVDITIVNVSVPTISGNLGVSSEEGEWTITFFGVANAICIPLTGWLGRRFGQVRLFLGAVTAFTFASILCGLAPSFHALLLFRILQGAVAGPIVPLSQALLIAIFPPERRTFAVAMWAMTNMMGPVAGPVLGGWVTDQYSWPWIFLINAPVGVFVFATVFVLLRRNDTPTMRTPVDLAGLLLLAMAVGCLQIACDRGRTLDWFASPFIVTMIVLSVAGFIVLVIWELGEAHPIIDLRLFEHRNFAVGTLAVAIGFGLFFAALVLIPLWLQTQLGYTSTWAGLVTAPAGLCGVVLAPFLGRWVAKGDARFFASISFAVWALVAFWRTGMTTGVTAGEIALIHLFQGLGMAFFLTPLVSLSLLRLSPDKLASASGLQTAIRMMAGSIFAALAQTFWDQRSRMHQTHLVDALGSGDRADAAVQTLRENGFGAQQAWGLINRQLDLQAHMLALNDFFVFSAFAFAAALGIIWLARGPSRQ
jgi:DHA2 family multidrug resistance protein